jgi:AcrR family transcriptional regulator
VTERPYHHGNLRTALLDQAARIIREHGPDELSLRELARQVGVSHSAPRRHFADRQALLAALAEAGFARLGADLQRALDGAGADYAERLRAAALAYVRFATEDAALLALMFASKHQIQSDSLNESAEAAFFVLLELIRAGQAAGVLEQGEPERVGLLLFATLQGIAALVTSGMLPSDLLDQVVGDAVAQFMRGGSVSRTGNNPAPSP